LTRPLTLDESADALREFTDGVVFETPVPADEVLPDDDAEVVEGDLEEAGLTDRGLFKEAAGGGTLGVASRTSSGR